jgi:hypothetical protein
MAPQLLLNHAHGWLLAASRGKLGGRVGGRPVLALETPWPAQPASPPAWSLRCSELPSEPGVTRR